MLFIAFWLRLPFFYSVAGNSFLCASSSSKFCGVLPKPVNGKDNFTLHNHCILNVNGIKLINNCYRVETGSSQKYNGRHHMVLSIALIVSFTFVVSVVLLVGWVHCYRSHLVFTSYGTFWTLDKLMPFYFFLLYALS